MIERSKDTSATSKKISVSTNRILCLHGIGYEVTVVFDRYRDIHFDRRRNLDFV